MWSRPARRGAAAALLRRRIASATRRSLRAELEALYEEHNPSKLADVDALAAKYGEAKLLAMARKKYGLPPPSAALPPRATSRPLRLHTSALGSRDSGRAASCRADGPCHTRRVISRGEADATRPASEG